MFSRPYEFHYDIGYNTQHLIADADIIAWCNSLRVCVLNTTVYREELRGRRKVFYRSMYTIADARFCMVSHIKCQTAAGLAMLTAYISRLYASQYFVFCDVSCVLPELRVLIGAFLVRDWLCTHGVTYNTPLALCRPLPL